MTCKNQIYNSTLFLHVVDRQRLLKLKTQKRLLFLFPLPTSLDNHQLINAMEYKKLNNCYIYDEKNIDYSALTKNFIDEIKKIKKNKVKRNQEKKSIFN